MRVMSMTTRHESVLNPGHSTFPSASVVLPLKPRCSACRWTCLPSRHSTSRLPTGPPARSCSARITLPASPTRSARRRGSTTTTRTRPRRQGALPLRRRQPRGECRCVGTTLRTSRCRGPPRLARCGRRHLLVPPSRAVGHRLAHRHRASPCRPPNRRSCDRALARRPTRCSLCGARCRGRHRSRHAPSSSRSNPR